MPQTNSALRSPNKSHCTQQMRVGFIQPSGRRKVVFVPSRRREVVSTRGNKYLFLAIFIFLAVAPINAQNDRWYDGFFIEGAIQYYFAPEIFSELIDPDPGFLAAIGYEYKHIRLAVESGYTHITGTNPIVLDFDFVPLVLKAGYALPIWNGLGLQADLSIGFLYSKVTHYYSALDLFRGIEKISNEQSLIAGAHLYGFYEFPHNKQPKNLIKIYAGGGVDALNEPEGIIPLPLIEAGIAIKPLTLIRKKAPAIAHEPEELVAEETDEGKTFRLINAVYFQANSVAILEQYLQNLDDAAKRLQENPDLQLTLRAYSAPHETPEWQVRHVNETPALSDARARYCADYIMQKSGVLPQRITIEHISADQLPHFDGASLESYRCVELVIK